MSWTSELIQGRVEVARGERIGIVLKAGDRTLAQASIQYIERLDKRFACYLIPVPSPKVLDSVEGCLNVCIENESNTVIKEVLVSQLLVRVKQQSSQVTFIDKLAPSFGFIGGALNQPLSVSVGMTVTKLRVCLQGGESYLNFSNLSVLGREQQTLPVDAVSKVSFSSSKVKNLSIESLTTSGFHSDLEVSPWLDIEFVQPQYVSDVRFVNRGDKWGIRSKQLNILGQDINGRIHHIYDNDADADKLELYRRLQFKYGALNFHSDLSREEALSILVDDYASVSNVNDLEESDILLIPLFLSSWAKRQATQSEARLEIKLLAIYLCYFMKVQISLNLMCFENLLTKRSAIQQLEDDINATRTKSGLSLIEITKHGTALASKLTENPKIFVESLKTLIDDLDELNAKPCLAYGTLLGAVRDNQFIAHDDDVDIIIGLPTPNLTKEQALEEHERIAAQLDSQKYIINRATKSGANLNLHVYVIKTGVLIDLFPYWVNDDQALLHMEKMNIRGIPADILDGRSSIRLYDQEFPIPEHSEAFLAQRYGDGWATPDKFHEWPWKLED